MEKQLDILRFLSDWYNGLDHDRDSTVAEVGRYMKSALKEQGVVYDCDKKAFIMSSHLFDIGDVIVCKDNPNAIFVIIDIDEHYYYCKHGIILKRQMADEVYQLADKDDGLVEQAPVAKRILEGVWYTAIRDFEFMGRNALIKGRTYYSYSDDTLCGEDNKDIYLKWEASDYVKYWTLEDAKPGDILIAEHPFIYAGMFDKDYPEYPCAFGGMMTNGEFEKNNFIDRYWTRLAVFPAQKEERNQLTLAMAKAGYKWDAKMRDVALIHS